jgi:hypothetical protein
VQANDMCRQMREHVDVADAPEFLAKLGAHGCAVVDRFHKCCGFIGICAEQLFLTEKLR